MNPDFSHFITKYQAANKQITVVLSGPLTVEKDRNGTAIHGHTGDWPERYAISVWVRMKRGKVTRLIEEWGRDMGGLPVHLLSTSGTPTIGDSGELYQIYDARIPAP